MDKVCVLSIFKMVLIIIFIIVYCLNVRVNYHFMTYAERYEKRYAIYLTHLLASLFVVRMIFDSTLDYISNC
jgi:cytochrome c oxidase subunit IV